jgi:hypothetical protein
MRQVQARFWVKGILLVVAATVSASLHAESPHQPINTLGELFAALRACWEPPPLDGAHDGMELTVRFSLTRFGRIFGKVAVTFESQDASDDNRRIYRKSVADALERSTPFPITDAFGNAIAGRPLAIRFIDTRRQRSGAAATHLDAVRRPPSHAANVDSAPFHTQRRLASQRRLGSDLIGQGASCTKSAGCLAACRPLSAPEIRRRG